MKRNGTEIQKGFFKRLFSYISTKNYERKKFANENYKLNWDQIKWRYRIGKLFFIFGFYFTGKYFFVDRILNNKFLKEEISNDRQTIKDYLERGLDQEELDYNQILNKIKLNNSNFFKIEHFENLDEENLNIKQDKEITGIYKITENLIRQLKSDEGNVYNLEKSSFDNLDLKSALKILKIKKKYDENNIDEDFADVLKFAEKNYKFLLTGSFIPNRVIQFSSNLLKEFSSIEEVAFVMAMCLYDFSNVKLMNKNMSEEILKFLDKAIEVDNKNIYLCFNEDLKLLKRDLINEKNISTFILSNPLFQFYFRSDLIILINNFKSLSEELYFKKIPICLKLLKDTGYDINKLTKFKFDKINIDMFGITDQNNMLKNKFEKYLKIKIAEIQRENTNQENKSRNTNN